MLTSIELHSLMLYRSISQCRKKQFNGDQSDLEWIVVKANVLPTNSTKRFETWLERNNCNVVWCATITSKVAAGPEQWYLVHKKPRSKLASVK